MHGSRIVSTVPLPSPSLCSAWLTYPSALWTNFRHRVHCATQRLFKYPKLSPRPQNHRVTRDSWAGEPPRRATSWINYAPPINQLIWLKCFEYSVCVCVCVFFYRAVEVLFVITLSKFLEAQESFKCSALFSWFEAVETRIGKSMNEGSFATWMKNVCNSSAPSRS